MSDDEVREDTLAELLGFYASASQTIGAVKAYQNEVRARIDAKLRARWAEEGTLPTVRHPDGICTAYLGGGGPRATITDHEAYAHWVTERMPEAVMLVVDIPMKIVHSEDFQRIRTKLLMLASGTHSLVAAGTLDTLVAAGHLDTETRRLISADGEPVEGVAIVTAEPTLTVRPAKAKEAT